MKAFQTQNNGEICLIEWIPLHPDEHSEIFLHGSARNVTHYKMVCRLHNHDFYINTTFWYTDVLKLGHNSWQRYNFVSSNIRPICESITYLTTFSSIDLRKSSSLIFDIPASGSTEEARPAVVATVERDCALYRRDASMATTCQHEDWIETLQKKPSVE